MFAFQLCLISLLVFGAYCENAERFMEYIVGRHNNFRQRWNMGREWEHMEWDNSLAMEADRRMSECRMGDGYYSRGEHYAYYSGGDHYYNIRRTFDEWYSGMNGFDWKNSEGDFYQMDWYRSRSVGCAMMWCPSFYANGENYQNMWYFGCFYQPREYMENNEFNEFRDGNENSFNNGYYWNGNDNFNRGYGANFYNRGYNMNNDVTNNGFGGKDDYYYNRGYFWNGSPYGNYYRGAYWNGDYNNGNDFFYNRGYNMNNNYNNGFGNGDFYYNRGYNMNNDYYNNWYGNGDFYNRGYYWNRDNYNGDNSYNRGYYMNSYYNNGNGYGNFYNDGNGYGNFYNDEMNGFNYNMEENRECEDMMPNCGEYMDRCNNDMFYGKFQCRRTCGFC